MHSPSHIRDAFCELVVDGITYVDFLYPNLEARFEDMDADEQLWWLAGQLWNCTDVMPYYVCDELELELGSTYARGARASRELLREKEPVIPASIFR